MKPDLKSMTRKGLEKLKTDIDKALAKVETREKKAAIAAAEKALKAHGFSLADITGSEPTPKQRRKAAKKPTNPGKPKYANPNNKTQTWTDKGRQPDWFKTALAEGKAPGAMEI